MVISLSYALRCHNHVMVTILFGLLLQWLRPLHLSTAAWPRIAGGVLAVANIIVGLWALKTMRRSGTHVSPAKPSLVIVMDGPFRFTRNPLYLTGALVYLGLTLAFNIVWPLVLFLPMALLLHWGIVLREERYLESKFGAAYLGYKARVRRWL